MGIPELLIIVAVVGGAWAAWKVIRVVVRGITASIAEGIERGKQAASGKTTDPD